MADEVVHVNWKTYEIFRRQLTVKGSFAQIDCFERSLTYLRSGRVNTEGIITHQFPLDDYSQALAALQSPLSLKSVVVH